MIPLVVRSHFSLMWGTTAPNRLCRAAKRLGYSTLALTDTDNLHGLPAFLKYCEREGLAPIVGAEVTDPARPHRAVCLVENEEGYRNLCRLLSARHAANGKARTRKSAGSSFDLQRAVERYAGGLIVLTGDAELLSAWHEAGVTVAVG